MARGEGPDPVDIHVGERIRLRRAMLRLTQQDLAQSIGISFQQLQKYERGANRVSASRLFDIASHLDVPISFFFEDIENDLLEQRGLTNVRPDVDPSLSSEALKLMAVFNRLPNDT
ncbi:helix-turn-helix transcriptional regulator, partial [uncultured Rhodospira sp.]|uniref:helix-turn-helix domain-containing protein n=1 Tax=uncultured Rhodospira sp. TaxID=1936189 RepID=UPI0026291797